ncbi:amidoligase enzyme [Cellulophaga phage phi14:2]|uniref:Amidoligase enzyme n=1 Tax=Cellulophaga phage phi14:2 TaxID=1327990 RepID=S0A2A0_9CAUD|nr:amidoligase enzyme [Cellulophaga phage phi14:2]AGO48930.1 hypothetical protein Phi14:2_gp052 [Cellulophaga phage phi14:2]
MSTNMVKTYTGKTAPKSKCKRIKNSYYLVGDPSVKDSGECYFVEGKYHRFNNGYIEYDHSLSKYVLIHKTTLREGIVDYDEEGNEFISGMFSPDISSNVQIVTNSDTGSKEICISEEIAKKGKFRERLSTGTFFDRTIKNATWFNRITKAPVSKSSLPYESRFVSKLTEAEHTKSFKPEYNSVQLNRFGDFLQNNGITFGLEFETTAGYIPERLCYKYGLIPLRDGSIEGLEYVTIPFSGRNGLYALKEITKELSKRTKNDFTCALHLHIGGLSRTEESVLSAFILSCLTQDEQFLMQPDYKRGGSKVQKQDYCAPLPVKNIFSKMPEVIKPENVTTWFKKVFNFVSDGKSYDSYKGTLDNIETHPSDPSGRSKWNIRSRYFYLNFVPLIFGNKKTVEFRHHHITTDFDKIMNLIFNCALFVWTAENCKDSLFNDKSELFSKLIKRKNQSTATLVENFLKYDGHSSLMEIGKRHIDYVEIRKTVMSELSAAGDVKAVKEKAHDALYNELGSDFWK